MAKELPYFQFEPAHYLTGSIQFCSLAAQGLFTNIQSIYWQRECDLTLDQVKKRFNYPELINELIKEGVIKVKGDKIIIQFLINQYHDAIEVSKKNSASGKKGMAKRWNKDNATITTVIPALYRNDNQTITIKEDNIIEDEIKREPLTHPLCLWIKNSLPNVSKIKSQLTNQEAERLVTKIDKSAIRDILENMENKADLLKKYKSVNLTIQSWANLRGAKNPETFIPKKEDYSAQNDFYQTIQSPNLSVVKVANEKN